MFWRIPRLTTSKRLYHEAKQTCAKMPREPCCQQPRPAAGGPGRFKPAKLPSTLFTIEPESSAPGAAGSGWDSRYALCWDYNFCI